MPFLRSTLKLCRLKSKNADYASLTKLMLLSVILVTQPSFSQTKNVVSESAMTSPRLDAAKHSVAPFVEGLSSFGVNPAGIGGIERNEKGWIRSFQFPVLAGAQNDQGAGAAMDSMLAFGASGTTLLVPSETVADSGSLYSRSSLLFGFEIGRILISPVIDYQLAMQQNVLDPTSQDILMRNTSGIAAGLSLRGFKDQVTVGVSTQMTTMEIIEGTFTAADLASIEAMDSALEPMTSSYSGTANMIGVHWSIQSLKDHRPVLSYAVEDFGNTTYTKSAGEAEASEIVKKQKSNLAFGISPSLSRMARMNFSIGARDILGKEVAVKEKLATTLEFELGPFGSKSYISARVGMDAVAPSYGLQGNLGMVGLQASFYQVDTAADTATEAILENRQSFLFWLDLAE